MNQKRVRAFSSLGLVLAALIWGFAFVVVKNSLDQIPPTYMLAFRFTIAAAGLGILFHRQLRGLGRHAWVQGGILGLLLFLSYELQTIGCHYTTAGKNAFLTTSYVVMVPFLDWMLSKKRPDRYCVAAAFLAIFGIGLLSLEGDLSMNIGDALTLACGVGYALHMIYISRFTQSESPVVLTVLQIGVAALLSWILAPLLEGRFPAAAFRWDCVASMLYLGLLSTMAAYLLQNVGQKYTTASTASILLSLESVFGIFFSTLFLQELFTLKMATGCGLIFVAVIMAETKFSFLRKEKAGV